MNVKDKSKGISMPDSSVGSRIRGLRKSLGLNQTQFAERFGVSQVAVSRWEKGEDTPSGRILFLMADLTSDEELKSSLLALAGFAGGHRKLASLVSHQTISGAHSVRLLRDSVAAGTPRSLEEKEIEAWLPLPKRFLSGGELVTLKVKGDSMAPTVPDGHMVVVDTAQKDPKKLVYRMVAAREGDGVTIKWLREDHGTYLLVPQHTSIDHPVRVMRNDGDFSIVGAVVWIMGPPPVIRR